MPRVLRYALRGCLGQRLLDYDQCNAHFSSMWDIIVGWGAQGAFDRLRDAIVNKADYLHDLGFVAEDAQTHRLAKQQYLAIGYQCGRKPEWTPRVEAFWCNVRNFYREVEARYPEMCAIARDQWHKERPAVTIGSYLMCHGERVELDKMDAAATGVVHGMRGFRSTMA